MEKFLLLGVAIHWLVSGFKKITCKSSRNDKTTVPKYLQIVMMFKDYILTPIIFMALIYFSFNPPKLQYLAVRPNTWRWNVTIILIVVSIFLKAWSYKALGNSWSDKLRVDEKLKLITTGPYKYFRHPVYLSYVIFLTSVIMSGNIFLPLLFLIFVLCNSAREEEEEEEILLKEQFLRYTQKMGTKVTSTDILVSMVVATTLFTAISTIITNVLILFKHFI